MKKLYTLVDASSGDLDDGWDVNDPATIIVDDGTNMPKYKNERTGAIKWMYRSQFMEVEEPTPPVVSRGGGQKFDEGKPQARLIFEDCPLALREIMLVMSGAVMIKGYEPHSWETVPNAEDRYSDAKFRHMLKRLGGETIDSDFGLRHRAHEIVNDLFLLEFELREEQESAD